MSNEAALADLTYDDVNAFYQAHFPKVLNAQQSLIPDPYDPDRYNSMRDQMVRGSVKVTRLGDIFGRVQKDQEVEELKEGMPPGNDEDKYLAIYVKGHALKKIIYCKWNSDTIFYLPMDATGKMETLVKQKSELVANNFGQNRFDENGIFYFFDKRKIKWIVKKFSEFEQIERYAKADLAASKDCNGRG